LAGGVTGTAFASFDGAEGLMRAEDRGATDITARLFTV
jgi:hypothetical protein